MKGDGTKVKFKIGKRWVWTVQPWEKMVGEFLGMIIWAGAWVAFGMMLVDGFAFHAM